MQSLSSHDVSNEREMIHCRISVVVGGGVTNIGVHRLSRKLDLPMSSREMPRIHNYDTLPSPTLAGLFLSPSFPFSVSLIYCLMCQTVEISVKVEQVLTLFRNRTTQEDQR